MKLPNRVYDILKYIVLIFLPAILTFLATILPLLGVSADLTQTIVKVGMALDTLIGALIGISTISYNREIAEKSVEEYESEDDR